VNGHRFPERTLRHRPRVWLLHATVDRMKNRSDETIVQDLRELIAALDRRVTRLERAGERDIVHDAAALRQAALRRIAELDRTPAVPQSRR